MSHLSARPIRLTALLLLVVNLFQTGCRSRMNYYQRADEDAFRLIHEKSEGTPWSVPLDYSIEADPSSRHFRPDDLTRPTLPEPITPLYSYDLGAIRANVRLEPEELAPPTDALDTGGEDELRGAPISPEAWKTIPVAYRQRMLDFATIREEAAYTEKEFGEGIGVQPDNEVPRLTLEDIVDLAITNSRDFLTQKENLYLAALRLAQERFFYEFRFASNGFGTGASYLHSRSVGITQDNLSVPTDLRFRKALLTGGDLFATFANRIFLTFNGPSGFAADVGSDVVVQLIQPLIQTDLQFESLTQAERNLVYEARRFARTRKQLFVDFAADYYSLIREFRQIEIESQNYFSLVREFNRAEAEYQTGAVSRVQLDQVEQNLLSGRGSLISTAVGVERRLDSLKLAIGIPVETPINIDLDELNELTRLDQVSVSADSINRILLRLKTSLKNPDRIELSSTAAVLLERVVESLTISPRQQDSELVRDYQLKRLLYLIDYARLTAAEIYAELEREVQSDSPSPALIFQRAQAHSDSLLNLITQQINYARLKYGAAERDRIDEFEKLRQEKAAAVDGLVRRLGEIVQSEGLDKLPELVAASETLRQEIEALVQRADQFNELTVETDPEQDLQRMVRDIEQLIEDIQPRITAQLAGLTPIDIDEDEAMLTALVLRFDLMNERGTLADDWRQIKLAADNLRSFIDLDASQTFSTNPTLNRPFNFSFNDSQTRLGLAVDAPVNRFAQRNQFRQSLINYQRALRDFTLLEDNIKLSIRNDLRNLTLDREQYLIAVASAALAYERVVSTSIEFRLGTPGVAARDFLEAQTAYVNSLSQVAARHINYIVDRTQLFIDLELLTVDEAGFWQDLRNEAIKPEPATSIPEWGRPVYGELPPVRYSDEIQQMLWY